MSNPGPVALITGAARRIGAVIAGRLHAAGFDLALHYRNSGTDAEALRVELESQRADSVLLLPADLTDTGTLPGLVERCVERFGRLDALVNNASGFFPTPVGVISESDWDHLFASNAKAPLFLAQAAAPHLRASAGAIVNLADIYAERPLAGHTVYVMAKAALVAMTRSLAIELAPRVRVNAIAPGAILWPDDGKDYTDRQRLLAGTPLGRLGEPEDIAEAVLYLLAQARYTTGQVLTLDGGRSLAI